MAVRTGMADPHSRSSSLDEAMDFVRTMMNKLSIRYRYDAGDDFGWLSVAVTTENFSGKGGFWVQWQDVLEFGEALSAYPIAKDAPITAQWGYEKLEGDDLIIAISISPKNALGELLASVEIAEYIEKRERLKSAFRTTYSALDIFRQDIAKLMKSEIEEAVLMGH